MAPDLAINAEKLEACQGSKKVVSRIEADIAFASELEIVATPTIFIDGRRLAGGETADQMEGPFLLKRATNSSHTMGCQA